MPMSMYRDVQTGPKMVFGGLKKGLCKAGYHVLTPWMVKYPEIPPVSSVTSRQPVSSSGFFMRCI